MYHHMNRKMQIKTGKCHRLPTVLEKRKIELSEQWQWTSGDYSKGQSLLVEVYDNETFIGAGGVSFYQVMPTILSVRRSVSRCD